MTVENKINELRALIDKIKEHSDSLNVEERLSVLELNVIISKITKLNETAIILKYLAKREHGINLSSCDDELSKTVSSDSIQIRNIEESVEEVLAVPEENVVEEPEELIQNHPPNTEEKEPSIDIEEPLSLFDGEVEETVSEDINLEEIVENSLADVIEEEKPLEETETVTDFFDEVLNREESPISINEIENKEELSSLPDINERFSDKEDASLGDHLQKQPVPDLVAAIGLNERYLYASELFNGEMTDFKRSVQLLNDFETGEEAKSFFNNELRPSYGWEEDNELASALFKLVERRYL